MPIGKNATKNRILPVDKKNARLTNAAVYYFPGIIYYVI